MKLSWLVPAAAVLSACGTAVTPQSMCAQQAAWQTRCNTSDGGLTSCQISANQSVCNSTNAQLATEIVQAELNCNFGSLPCGDPGTAMLASCEHTGQLAAIARPAFQTYLTNLCNACPAAAAAMSSGECVRVLTPPSGTTFFNFPLYQQYAYLCIDLLTTLNMCLSHATDCTGARMCIDALPAVPVPDAGTCH
jgi:hypothetical protein